MLIEYRRSWDQSAMLIEGNDAKVNYELDMLENCKVDGILPPQLLVEGGEVFIQYEITGLKSLENYLEGRRVTLDLIQELIENIIHVCRETDKYLLEENHLLLRTDTIFKDVKSRKMYFCYYPVQEQNLKKSIKRLLEDLLVAVDHSDKEKAQIIYRIYEHTQEENYSVMDLQEYFLEKKETDAVCAEVSYIEEIETEEEWKVAEETVPFFNEWLGKARKLLNIDKIKEICVAHEKKKTLVENEWSVNGEMAVELERKQPEARLIYLGNGEERDFTLNKEIFLIGRNRELAHGVLGSEVSADLHAKIIRKENRYYIEDMNSKNGTLVNGEFLVYKKPRELQQGDRITFGDVSYRFLTFCHNSII